MFYSCVFMLVNEWDLVVSRYFLIIVNIYIRMVGLKKWQTFPVTRFTSPSVEAEESCPHAAALKTTLMILHDYILVNWHRHGKSTILMVFIWKNEDVPWQFTGGYLTSFDINKGMQHARFVLKIRLWKIDTVPLCVWTSGTLKYDPHRMHFDVKLW